MEKVRDEFGDDVARLVEGVTKLTRIHFQSREQAQAENYRKMIVAMAEDHRVILIKLADRLHNMRTIEYLGKQKQLQKARETLEVYAPLAHRLGIHTIKWELEDLAFQTNLPRKYAEIQAMVNERRAEREKYVDGRRPGVEARARQGRHPRRDLLAREALLLHLREDGEAREGVQRDLRPDRDARPRRARRQGGRARLLRRAGGHPLDLEPAARPLQGLRGRAQVQHVPLAAHDGDRARGEAARDPGANARDAQDGRARHRRPLALQGAQGQEDDRGRARLDEAARRLAARGDRLPRAHARVPGACARRGLRLHAQGRGEEPPRRLDADRLRLLGAHGRRPPHRRRQGQRAHRAAPLPPSERRLRRDPDLEADDPRPVARLARARRVLARAEQDPPVVQPRDPRGRRAARP